MLDARELADASRDPEGAAAAAELETDVGVSEVRDQEAIGLALMRLDRVEDALAAKTALEAGGITVRTVKPSWATFDWPGEAKTVS